MNSEIRILYDKYIFPNDAVLEKHLGDAKKTYDSLAMFFAEHECEMQWNFYYDGKSWLCKVVKKKKTICWISVWENYFKITFYFGLKCEEGIKNLDISEEFKIKYFATKATGKIKPLTLKVCSSESLIDIARIFFYKEQLR